MSEGPFGRRGGEPPAPPPRSPPPPEPAPPRAPRSASSFTWIVGVLVVILLAYITLNSIRTEGPGSRGLEVGDPLPPFAAPLAVSKLNGDANIARKAGSGNEGKVPACSVRGRDIVNVCQLAERGPVVIVFFATKSERCLDQVDLVERVRAEFPDVQFAAVSIRGDREEVRSAVRKRGWKIPVAYDRDGAVSNLYAVAVCPTITFARADGKVSGTALRFLDERELGPEIRRLTG